MKIKALIGVDEPGISSFACPQQKVENIFKSNGSWWNAKLVLKHTHQHQTPSPVSVNYIQHTIYSICSNENEKLKFSILETPFALQKFNYFSMQGAAIYE